MIKTLLFVTLFVCFIAKANAVFTNPGIPTKETVKTTDYLDVYKVFVTGDISLELREEKDGNKYYFIEAHEEKYYTNKMKLRYADLTTVYERRFDKDNNLLEAVEWQSDRKYRFFNREKGIDRIFDNSDDNYYSRYAYFISFRGFPFSSGGDIKFKSYMSEAGGALPMNLHLVGKESVKVPAGVYDCYKLELSVGGWRSFFARDKYYLYFNSIFPYQFVKYSEKSSDGKWLSNELVQFYYKK